MVIPYPQFINRRYTMIEYKITFETRADADAGMEALEEASLECEIERPFQTELVNDTGDEE
jgi:hypothetical protein